MGFDVIKRQTPWPWTADGIPLDLRPYTPGLIMCVPMWSANTRGIAAGSSGLPIDYDFANRTPATSASSVDIFETSDETGFGYDFGAGRAAGLSLNRDVLGGLTEFTVMVAADRRGRSGSSGRYGIFGRWSSGQLSFLWRVQGSAGALANVLCQVSLTSGVIATTSETVIPGTGLVVYAARYRDGVINQFFNGDKDPNSDSDVSGTPVDTISVSHSFSSDGSNEASQPTFNATQYGGMAWNRGLDDDAIKYLSLNFFRFFEQAETAPMFAFGPTTTPPVTYVPAWAQADATQPVPH